MLISEQAKRNHLNNTKQRKINFFINSIFFYCYVKMFQDSFAQIMSFINHSVSI